MIHGVLIGINQYEPPITRLSGACADARAFGALFQRFFAQLTGPGSQATRDLVRGIRSL